jgi:invasion protein IalB
MSYGNGRNYHSEPRVSYLAASLSGSPTICAAMLIAIALAAPAHAQNGPKALGSFEAWTAIELPEKTSKVCYMAARPIKSQPEGAKRGDILLTIMHRPAAKQRDEVSFQSGYPFKPGAPVVIDVEKKKFDLFTKPEADAEGAWARDAAMDKALVEAMKNGNSLTIKGTSGRGTETTDTFSLAGFTKAYAEIGKACGIK